MLQVANEAASAFAGFGIDINYQLLTTIYNAEIKTLDNMIDSLDQSQENITVARPLAGGRSMKNNRSSYDTPRPRQLSIVL